VRALFPDDRRVAKMLEGAEPGNWPVEETTRFEPVINKPNTATALGLTIPQSPLRRENEVIR